MLAVYVTFSVSPLLTERFPPVNAPQLYSVPVVPPFVLFDIKKQPAMVAVPLMLNAVAVVAFEPAEADPNEGAGRVELL